MKMPKPNNSFWEKSKEYIAILIIIFGLLSGAILIAGWMSDDIEAKNVGNCLHQWKKGVSQIKLKQYIKQNPDMSHLYRQLFECRKCGMISFELEFEKPNEPEIIKIYDGNKMIEYVPKVSEPNISLSGKCYLEKENEPNELSELTISCLCGWTHEIHGKELAYRSRYTKVTELENDKINLNAIGASNNDPDYQPMNDRHGEDPHKNLYEPNENE